MNLNILFAFIPLFGWAFGDFFIQRTTRKIGNIESLFFISFLTIILLLPFQYQNLTSLNISQVGSFFSLAILIFIYAIVLFQAFKVGKLSVLESVVSLEIPISIGLAIAIAGDKLSGSQLILFLLTTLGIFLATLQKAGKKEILEKGVYMALAAAGLSAMTNVYLGILSQNNSPFMTILVVHSFLALFCFITLIYQRQVGKTLKNLFKYPKIIFLESFFDNAGWIGYTYAVTLNPISIVVTISAGYIVLASMMGYLFNREVLSWRQKIGAVIAMASIIMLSFISK